ncbi:PHB depolymerase family esterase [Sphingomonas sp. URHD0057]|uniref:PHB depolymerase family esterase n=1 Tax=Sphingomonas sp. URHD0057 TaxID=1380389 RepID=UPI0004902467|nr:PHB depolymerase family esterase [Sphingomonas sp. URHD0057]
MKLRVFGALVAFCSIAASPGSIAKFKAVTFTETTPLARNGELIKRLLSPFASADLAKKNDAAVLNAFPINPKDEKFGLYVPAEKPAKGYGLLVWVSPLDGAGMPLGWPPTLEDRGVIFVTAARSGNDTSPLGRRIPLALTAAANVARNHAIDPDRIWIAGFSGGARIAERMALAYPDVFSGAILDGSSDSIGSNDLPLPPRENFERLLERMSMVFSTGEEDEYNTADAKRVVSSLRGHCFDRLSVEVRPHEGHDMMNGRSLAKAIEFLDRTREEPSPGDRQCREEFYSKIDGELARADAIVQHGGRGARAAIRTIDRRYGRLAAPRSLELRARVGA